MLSRVDVSGSELQKKSKIDILWIHDVMHIAQAVVMYQHVCMHVL